MFHNVKNQNPHSMKTITELQYMKIKNNSAIKGFNMFLRK